MKKIKYSREIKLGIMAIVAIFLLYFGLNFLKGVDIFTPVNYHYTIYKEVDGLVASAPVYIKGYKVGQVESVKYDFTKEDPFLVKISVSKDINIPKGAVLELFDDGLMGGKAMQIVNILPSAQSEIYVSGDTLPSQMDVGLLGQLTGELMPGLEVIMLQADSLMRSLRSLIDSDEIKKSLGAIERTTANLANSSSSLDRLMNDEIPQLMNNVQLIGENFKNLSVSLDKMDMESSYQKLDLALKDLNQITQKINTGEGSIGLLLNDKNLYINLLELTTSADSLLIDLKANPKRYVNFSLIGSKEK